MKINEKVLIPQSQILLFYLKRVLHFREMSYNLASLFTHFADLWKVMFKIINFVGKGSDFAAFEQFD